MADVCALCPCRSVELTKGTCYSEAFAGWMTVWVLCAALSCTLHLLAPNNRQAVNFMDVRWFPVCRVAQHAGPGKAVLLFWNRVVTTSKPMCSPSAEH